jgi:hypothetical protein
MKTIKQPFLDKGLKLIHPVAKEINSRKKGKIKNDIILNVDSKDAMIRFGILLFLAMLTLVTHTHLIIYSTPVIFYLFISALIRFCIIKYVWHRYIKHEPVPASPEYGEDPNYPEESI